MKAVVQRVSYAQVSVDGEMKGKIGPGLLVLLGIGKEDDDADVRWIIDKVIGLRIFPNEQGKFDRSLSDINGSLLLVSQFTLYGDCHKGRRPGFDKSAPPKIAEPLYNQAIAYAREKGVPTESGEFGALMQVELLNDGPVTLILESPKPL